MASLLRLIFTRIQEQVVRYSTWLEGPGQNLGKACELLGRLDRTQKNVGQGQRISRAQQAQAKFSNYQTQARARSKITDTTRSLKILAFPALLIF